VKRTELPAIVAAWAAAIAIVQPRGNFPMLDDWDFALATWRFAETGHFHFTQFTVVSLRAMVLWGAAWTRLFGESFEVLRASTLLLSLLTLLVVNRTLARMGVAAFPRVVATLALLVHPVFLWASCTYMTDVPFVFATAVALYAFTRGIGEERVGWVIAGCAAVAVSWFIRQNGVITLAAPLIVMLLQRKRRLIPPLLVTGVAFLLLALFRRAWLSGTPEMFAVHYQMWGESSFRLPQQLRVITDYLVFNAQNCGLFFLPLTLPLLAWRPRFSRRGWLLVGLLAAVVIGRVAILAAEGYLIPYSGNDPSSDILPGNLLFDWGVGPPLLTDTFTLGHPYPFRLAMPARALLTALSALLAVAVIVAAARARNLGTFAAAAGTAILLASGYYYDRYSLDSAWPVVLALPFVIPWQRRGARIAAIVALVVVGAFSLFAVQECFAWQRARWAAWRDLRAQGIAVQRIDGGAEAFGLYELPDASRAVARRGHPPREFVIAFRNLPGYRVIARYPFGWRGGTIVALRRISGTSG
jgi:hypothetical protein